VAALFNPVPVLWARLALARGEVAEAAHWAKRRGLAPGDRPRYPREEEYLVLARVLLAEHATHGALGLLERLHDLAVAPGRTGSMIEARALQASALEEAGDGAGALAALAEALGLAAPEGYLRVFVDEGAPMGVLLGRLATAPAVRRAAAVVPVPPACLGRLLGAFDRAGAAVPPGLVVPLSGRELECWRCCDRVPRRHPMEWIEEWRALRCCRPRRAGAGQSTRHAVRLHLRPGRLIPAAARTDDARLAGAC
jgi:LuxR family maltose regulon positive regulatory protein